MHVTKSTAERLKAAGYPQNGEGGAFYIDDYFVSPWSEIAGTQSQHPGAIYAPDVVELLKAMSGKCLLSHTNGRWEVYVEYPQRVNFYGDNPAESLAEAYLFINKQL